MTNLELMDSIIKFRKQDHTFQRSIDERSEKMQFRFFDGPPFASGTPHYGHLLAGAIKDLIPRYMTMRGYQVKRKRGRDCHGLPVEKAVEKALGIDGKRDIETKIGIESFVEKCRAYVNDTNEVWQWFIDHTARRADVENEYRTMDLEFMESVMYCFDNIYKDNLVYKGFKVQRYCPSCATPLANNEVAEGYEDKTDNAITVKFQLLPKLTQKEMIEKFEHTDDGCVKYTKAIIKNDKGEILQLFSTLHHTFTLPGGKIDKGEKAETSLARELKEELGVETTKTTFLGAFKQVMPLPMWSGIHHAFEVEINGEVKNLEPDKHKQLVRVKVEPSETNNLGFQLVLENNIIIDEEEIQNQFSDLYFYLKQLPQNITNNTIPLMKGGTEGEGVDKEHHPRTSPTPSRSLYGTGSSEGGQGYGNIYLLARTTTPRTLPSNMFLAVGADIQYTMVYDFSSEEYYILASNLLKKYYKNADDYLVIRTFKGKELQGMYYEPLFDYITKSFSSPVIVNEAVGEVKQSISTTNQNQIASSSASLPPRNDYLNQFFQILNADFVSIEDGTGIVHIAPTFGEEDFQVVAKLLGAQNALEWLFMPVNEYGEFDEQVYDYTGESVLQINKTIIERLKEERKLIKSESITHSYPHCRRCHTPLINKAMSSRFIKEQQMNEETRKAAEHINFVPESVKNRFVNGLQQAPDRNIARNRYRGSPLPIWQNVDDENDRFSVGSLEEMYQLSRTGSKNITKHIFIRHGRTYYNEEEKQDNYGDKALLNEEGLRHSEAIKEKLQPLKNEQNLVIILSPQERVRQTIFPFLRDKYGETEVQKIRANYEEVQMKFRQLRNDYKIIPYLAEDTNEYLFEIGEQIFVDFRITEILRQDRQDKSYLDRVVGDNDEKIEQVVARSASYLKEISKKFPTATVISVSHGLPLTYQRQVCKNCVDSEEHKKTEASSTFYPKYYPRNNGEKERGTMFIHYRDNDRQKEVDLHKPYVDNYRFVRDGKTYKRVPEVMDCRFESGAMPFGQEHYVG